MYRVHPSPPYPNSLFKLDLAKDFARAVTFALADLLLGAMDCSTLLWPLAELSNSCRQS